MYTQKERQIYPCLLFSYHSTLQTDNEPNQIFSVIVINHEKYIYVPKSFGHFSHLTLQLAVCQLKTS